MNRDLAAAYAAGLGAVPADHARFGPRGGLDEPQARRLGRQIAGLPRRAHPTLTLAGQLDRPLGPGPLAARDLGARPLRAGDFGARPVRPRDLGPGPLGTRGLSPGDVGAGDFGLLGGLGPATLGAPRLG